MNNNFILQDVIDELINTDKSLQGPLMKLNYFGRLTKNSDLISFTTNELKGYGVEEDVPEYRKTIARFQVTAQSYFIEPQDLEMPFSVLPEEFQESFRYLKIREGIATVEKMAKQMEQEDKREFYKPMPLELLTEVQPKLRLLYKANPPLNAISSRFIGNGNVFLDIPTSIRTNLLELVMTIADEFGYDVEINEFSSKQINKTINNYMNTHITNTGDGNIINTGSENSISNSNTITKGNLDHLRQELDKQGVDPSDIDNLMEIVQEENPNENNTLGEKTTNWILDVSKKALNGVGKIASGVSSNLLATLIKGYFGI
jgi:AbiTii